MNQSIEELAKRYRELDNQKIVVKTKLEGAKRQLEEHKAETKEKRIGILSGSDAFHPGERHQTRLKFLSLKVYFKYNEGV